MDRIRLSRFLAAGGGLVLAGEGAICPADLADRTRAVTLSRPLGDRALRHAP